MWENLFIAFIIYSFLGWLTEVIFAFYKQGKFVNRGFLRGPLCPIYGCGVVLTTELLWSFRSDIIVLYLLSVLITSALELITGYILEIFFHISWWDYSDNKFNLDGKICLKFSLAWGLACVMIIKLVDPIVQDVINYINDNYANVRMPILQVILLVLAYDFIVTLNSLRNFKTLFKSLSNVKIKYNEELARIKANADIVKLKSEFSLKEEELFKRLTRNQKRIVESFPNLKTRRYKIIGEIKKWIKEFDS